MRIILVLKGQRQSEALKVNTSLNGITLCGNNIGDEGAKAIGEALKVNVNTSLTGIELAGNNWC